MPTLPTLVVHDSQIARMSLGKQTSACFASDGAQVLHLHLGGLLGRPAGVPLIAHVAVLDAADAARAAAGMSDAAAWPEAGGPLVAVVIGVAHDGQRSLEAWLRLEGSIQRCEVLRVSDGDGLFARTRGLLETSALAGRTVGIIGVGSGGAAIAVELAKAGVGRFVLIDPDRLEPANLSRHVCGLSDLGRAKVFAVRDLLLDRNPNIAVDALQLDVLHSPDRAREALTGADLIIGATDDNRSRGWVNRLALWTKQTAIFGRALTRAAAGDVLRVRPHAGPCLACVFSAGMDREEEVTSARGAANGPGYVTEGDRAALIQPGLASDIAPISNMMVRLALVELSRGTAVSLASLDEDLVADLYIWANRRERAYEAWAPMGYGSRTPSVLRWYGARAERVAECPECDPRQGAPVTFAAAAPRWG